MANLLPEHAPHKVPTTLSALLETPVRHHHDLKESIALLRRALHHDREQRTTRGHPQQPRSDRPSCREEHRTQSPRPTVQAPNINQSPSTPRLPGRVDKSPN